MYNIYIIYIYNIKHLKKSQLLKNILVHRISLSHHLPIYLSIYRSPVSSLFSIVPFPPRGRSPLRMQILVHFVNKHHERFKGKFSTNIFTHTYTCFYVKSTLREDHAEAAKALLDMLGGWHTSDTTSGTAFLSGTSVFPSRASFLNIPSRDIAYHSFSVSSPTVLTSRCSCKLLSFCIY